jgi:NitT/TauT family transport system substrate-binding protein
LEEVFMSDRRNDWSRRKFVGGLTLAGTAGFLGLQAEHVAAEPPPETTTIRLDRLPAICIAPQYVVEELLRAEGFTTVKYVSVPGTAGRDGKEGVLASGETDLTLHYAAPTLIRLEAGDPFVVLAGVHVGCFELFGTDRIHTIRDLKGKTVGIGERGSSRHVFVSMMAAYVGLDSERDIRWGLEPPADAKRLLAEGKIDAYLGFPPEPQELRAQKIGHGVVNSAVDRPWSQYFCCMAVGNRTWVRKHPVAAKRALRALLKAADVCATDPSRVARFLVERGYAENVEYAAQAVKGLPYRWREYDAEDTLRFYSLRLKEVGLIKSSPQKLIAQGADWRFLNELKKELKG